MNAYAHTHFPTVLRGAWHLAILLLFCSPSLLAAPPPTAVPTELQIFTTPADATVSINREERGSTPVTITDLPPGDHLVALSKRGYRDHYATVTLSANTRRTLDVSLEPLTTLVVAHSEPPGATVSSEGVDLGITPLLLTTLPPGTHRLRFSLAGFQPTDREITTDARTPLKISVTLLSDSGTLGIISQPTGATVIINGIPRGETPCIVKQIPEGDAAVTLRADGYRDIVQTVKLAAGETQRLALTLQPKPAQLRVVSLPPGARVYVNNDRRGETPLTLDDLPPGAYRVRVENDGFDPLARDVELARAAEVVEEFRLTPNTGALQITTAPADVEIFVAGKRTGLTTAGKDETTNLSNPLLIEGLSIGDHPVTFVRKGWAETAITITIERGQTVTRHVTLERLFIPDYEVISNSGTIYRGVFDAVTDIGVRLETAPGVMTIVPHKEIRRRGNLRDDTAE